MNFLGIGTQTLPCPSTSDQCRLIPSSRELLHKKRRSLTVH